MTSNEKSASVDEKLKLFRRHPCCDGLQERTARRIAEACRLLRLEPGDHVHQANDPLTAIFLVVQGRLKQTMIDVQDKVILERYETAGGQFGGMAAALAEPSPVNCVAEDPTTLLELDYQNLLKLTGTSQKFRLNVLSLLDDTMRQTLFRPRLRTKPQRVAFIHQSIETRSLTPRLIQRLTELGEQPTVLSDQPDWGPVAGVQHRCIFETDRKLNQEIVENHLVDVSRKRGRVFFDTLSDHEVSSIGCLFEIADQVYWVVNENNWEASIPQLQALQQRAKGWRDKIKLVWLLSGDHQLAPIASELRELVQRDIKLSFSNSSESSGIALQHGFERLIHDLRGIRIGVALGGGAARGMAHLGVLKALEAEGIVVDMIAGTSAGAMTGTLLASGLDADYLVDSFVRDLKPSWFFRSIPKGDQWYLVYKYRRGQFDPMLRKYLSDATLDQLPVPMHTVTVDLVQGKPVVRESGDAVHAIVESINLPGISSPINRKGQALIDGGLVNNVPADVLVSKGCNFVIAVSVTAKIKMEFAKNQPDTPTNKMIRASTVQTILRSYLVQNHAVNEVGVQPADVVIEPDVTQFKLTEFSRTDEMAQIGYDTTLKIIPEIKKQLASLDNNLFSRG